MHGVEGFLADLTLVLCAAGLTTVVFHRLRQPAVLGYLLAGILLGPSLAPEPLAPDPATVQTLSELGVVLLMFSLGLEFSVRKLIRLGARSGLVTAVETSLVGWLGFLAARLLGWPVEIAVFTGAMVAISSTMIIVKTFDDARVERQVSDLVFGVLVFEDVLAILLLALLTGVATGGELSAGDVAVETLRLTILVLALLVAGLMIVPRVVRLVVRIRSREITLVVTVGIAFAMALVARELGTSVALGAFLAGAVAAESGEARVLEPLVRPLRELFAAIFFVAVGMLIDPTRLLGDLPAVLLLAGVVVGGKLVGVTLGSLLAGHGVQRALRAGLSMGQIGEFSFLMAALATPLGPMGERLLGVAVATSVLTTAATPLLVRRSRGIATAIEHVLPRRMRILVPLWSGWLDQLGTRARPQTMGARARRISLLVLLDAVVLLGLVAGVSVSMGRLVEMLSDWTGLADEALRVLVVAATALASLPFLLGILAGAHRLGLVFADEMLPRAAPGHLDLAAAPRRSLVVGIQIVVVVVVLAPVLALSQPFLPALPGVVALFVAAAIIAWRLWRNTAGLQGHVRAGAELVVEVLARQSRVEGGPPALDQVLDLMPGLGELEPVRIEPEHAAAGRTLAELNLRGLTGASAVCIGRGEEGHVFPAGDERIQAGDVVVLAGGREERERARALLLRGL